MRLIFAGTPEFAAHQLKTLVESGYEIIAVYTQPDRPAGRGKLLTASPVKKLALTYDLPIYQPGSLKTSEEQKRIASHQADAMIVVAYGLILPQAVLDIPRFGCFNIHASLLPRWRGAAPIQRAIEAGDQETGITIMQMDAGLDTGDMLVVKRCMIEAMETSASLHDKLMILGSEAMLEALSQLEAGQLQPITQDNKLANYAEKIQKEEAKIKWSEPASLIVRKIRAFNPFPCAFSFLNGQRIKVHSAHTTVLPMHHAPGEILTVNEQDLIVACGKDTLAITKLQLPGKKPLTIQALLNGHSDLLKPGLRFGG